MTEDIAARESGTAMAALSSHGPSLSETMHLGALLAKSGYFADAREAAQAVVKILAGHEVGLPPIASMTNIHIVKGKVGFGATIMGALIKRSGKYDYRVKEHSAEACELIFFENGREVGTSRFTTQDAETAKLQGNDNWKNYPRNMVFARAMSNGAKWFCAEIFNGPVYTPEEIEIGEDVAQGAPAATAPVVVSEQGEVLSPRADAPITEPQKRRFWAVAREHGWKEDEVKTLLTRAGIEHTKDIPSGRYEGLVETLKTGTGPAGEPGPQAA